MLAIFVITVCARLGLIFYEIIKLLNRAAFLQICVSLEIQIAKLCSLVNKFSYRSFSRADLVFKMKTSKFEQIPTKIQLDTL